MDCLAHNHALFESSFLYSVRKRKGPPRLQRALKKPCEARKNYFPTTSAPVLATTLFSPSSDLDCMYS
jgi:hypothetical protein